MLDRSFNIIDAMKWRYATKRMTGETVPHEKIDVILEAIRLSPSSIGLQPYSVVVITDPHLKAEIRHTATAQPQITECSHLLVFAVWDRLTMERIDEFFTRMISARPSQADALKKYRDGLIRRMNEGSPETNFNWMARQAYIALGAGIVAAAEERVDATPMEGFTPEALDQLLRLPERGLRSVAMLALGYRDEKNDHLVTAPKVRRSKENLFIFLPQDRPAQVRESILSSVGKN